MRLCSISSITGRIRLLSGLHIGAGKDSVEIGGLDQPIIKDPLSGEPYIPGSSLKGKMRSLLESTLGLKRKESLDWIKDGKPCGCGQPDCPICTLFGAHKAPKDCHPDLGPSRLLVRDAYLIDADRELLRKGQLPMEIKHENTIDRIKGVAQNPRPLERVPAGVRFELNLALKVYESDKEKNLDQVIFWALSLIELDALGGCSSRGCGRVVFEDLKFNGEPKELPENVFPSLNEALASSAASGEATTSA